MFDEHATVFLDLLRCDYPEGSTDATAGPLAVVAATTAPLSQGEAQPLHVRARSARRDAKEDTPSQMTRHRWSVALIWIKIFAHMRRDWIEQMGWGLLVMEVQRVTWI